MVNILHRPNSGTVELTRTSSVPQISSAPTMCHSGLLPHIYGVNGTKNRKFYFKVYYRCYNYRDCRSREIPRRDCMSGRLGNNNQHMNVKINCVYYPVMIEYLRFARIILNLARPRKDTNFVFRCSLNHSIMEERASLFYRILLLTLIGEKHI